MRPWTVDLLKIYQIGSRRLVQVPDATLDSRLTEGITNPEHSAPGVSQWTHGGDVVSGTIGAVGS